MPKQQLQVRFEAENVAEVYIDDVEDFSWKIKVKCGSCNTESDFIFLQANEQVEQEGSRGVTNLLYKCTFCSRSGSIDVDPKSYKPIQVDSAGQKYQPLITFECRKGVEIVSWDPVGAQGVSCKGSSGTTFEVDLSEGTEWSDYDQEEEQSIGIYKIESQLVKV
ncbi:CXXC motif containing zinc binding protein [Acrasis kona]|uniref:CXXC motif containing zinc binding protein n=1 Tax=Acrasis kona TaxID=1008807 RepID=A0AAW2ZNA1_9EUKA